MDGTAEYNMDVNFMSQNELPFLMEESFDITPYVDNLGFTSPPSDEFFKDSKDFLQVPHPTSGPPIRGDFGGVCNFEISLNGNATDRKKFMYSHKLNRVFLNMLAEMPIQFKWDWDQLKEVSLWLRATLILSGTDQQESRVVRCHNHRVPTDGSNKDVPENILAHVLRSARQTTEVIYCGTEDDDQQWLSVAVPMGKKPPEGADFFNHVYKFCCKHSCTSGINRRRIEVLFTLEDNFGEIFGRRSLGVRVCSCPRRDMDKEEGEETKLRGDGPPNKKRLISNPRAIPNTVAQTSKDSNVYTLGFPIIGAENCKYILQVARDRMASEILDMDPSHPEYLKYQKILSEYKVLMSDSPYSCNPH
ncbi:transcription factor p53 isoform X2 [Arctopsyche grandis]